jgi:superfamily II DNA/RNA helicase
VIGQAQSGTGKTCVFGVVAVEAVSADLPALQALLLAPTREIALQTLAVVRALGPSSLRESCVCVCGRTVVRVRSCVCVCVCALTAFLG